MNTKTYIYRTQLVLCVLALMMLACKLPTIGGSNVKLGEEYRSAEGGYAFKQVPDYQMEEAMGISTMMAPDSNQDSGPAILLMAGVNDTEMTNQEALNLMQESAGEDLKIGKTSKVKADGVDGLKADLTGTSNGEDIEGFVVIVMITPTRQFTLITYATKDRWQKEIEGIANAVLDSVTFFEPTALVLEPDLPTEENVPELPEATLSSGDGALVEYRQWASSGIASSEYGSSDWSASQATGAPDVDQCSDSHYAWASSKSDSVEWIELTYATPVQPTQLTIIQSLAPNQVVKVEMFDSNGEYYEVWSGTPEKVDTCPYQQVIDITDANYQAVGVRITIDQSVLGLSWNEIDAVELVGMVEQGLVEQSPSEDNTSDPSGDIGGPVNILYTVISDEGTTTIQDGIFQDQSTTNDYVLGLMEPGDFSRHSVTLFLDRGVQPGAIIMEPYDGNKAAKAPSAAIFIGAWYYYATDGVIVVDSIENNTITGSFSFNAVHEQDKSKTASIAGTFANIPLP
jgi:hypothetical protein